MAPDDATVAARLGHVRWIGGGSGAGKSTIARRLAAEHGLDVYGTDDVMADHARRTAPEDGPELARFATMDLDQRWVDRSPEEMLETFHWYRGEAFGLVVEDLLALPADRPVIAEGFRLLPHLVQPLLAGPDRAVWLLPSPAFRRAALAARGAVGAAVDRTRDPDRARANLRERDRLFTERLRRETARRGLTALAVDGTLDEDALAARVAAALGLAHPPPRVGRPGSGP